MMKYPEIFKAVTAAFSVPENEWLKIEPHFQKRNLKKQEFLIETNQQWRMACLVLKGFLRIYYLGNDGSETVKVFRGPGELIAPYAEILTNAPSRSNIQALEESEVILIPYDLVAELAEKEIFWANFLRKVAELNYIEKERREYDFLNLSASERYLQLCKRFPEWVENIPQYQLASYLGITAVALSRLISKLPPDRT